MFLYKCFTNDCITYNDALPTHDPVCLKQRSATSTLQKMKTASALKVTYRAWFEIHMR